MPDLTARILAAVNALDGAPIKPRQLAKRLGIDEADYPNFRKVLKQLVQDGRLDRGGGKALRPIDPFSTVIGIYRRTNSGVGYVRPKPTTPGLPPQPDIRIREGRELDAASGDEVLVRLSRKASRHGDAAGEIVEILERATRTFVGEYFERDGQGFVRIDGTVFAHSVSVGDAGAKGVKGRDKVVVEMLRFPSSDDRGEAVITEVLGPAGKPGVDALTVIRALGLPEAFPADVIAEARAMADRFRDTDLDGRTDFTDQMTVTIDPVDARDFDDAISVEIDPETHHWIVCVHIADVAHFAPPGSKLDAEARNRGTSVYLPQRVIPMFPETISNGLASLQEGKLRYVKTCRIEYTPGLQKADVRFFNAAIRNKKRFTYEQVQAAFNAIDANQPTELPEPIEKMLKRARDLAARLRKKRVRRGTLELSMPEAVLEFDRDGRVTGAHFAANDESHRLIEEYMLAANEAVAEHLTGLGVPFLRRVHPAPNEEKLDEFAEFAKLLGYPMKRNQDRFELQRVLHESAEKPERSALHYGLLRSLKQAVYSPVQDQHYALAMTHYCHFTSPIRRYPDLTAHRLLDRWIRRQRVTADAAELAVLGDHCSKRERRAETAERELTKLKILTYLSTRIGEVFDAVITGVADYGFFAQAERMPAEGLVHISSLTDDYYRFDADHRSLFGGRTKRRFRLGDRVRVEVARVDVTRRLLDFRLAKDQPTSAPTPPPPSYGKPRKGKKKKK